MDIDPQRGFWPTRLLSRGMSDPDDRFTWPPTARVIEFSKFDTVWYPRVVCNSLVDPCTYQIVQHAEFGRSYSDSTFVPEIPNGTIVDDRIAGKRYVAGGDEGASTVRDQLSGVPTTGPTGAPVSTRTWSMSLPTLTGALGAVLMVVAVLVLVRRRLKT